MFGTIRMEETTGIEKGNMVVLKRTGDVIRVLDVLSTNLVIDSQLSYYGYKGDGTMMVNSQGFEPVPIFMDMLLEYRWKKKSKTEAQYKELTIKWTGKAWEVYRHDQHLKEVEWLHQVQNLNNYAKHELD